MRKLLLALVCMALSSAAFALKVHWEWDSQMDKGWESHSSAYMVYSSKENGVMTWQEVLTAAKSQSPTTGVNVSKSNLLDVDGRNVWVQFNELPNSGEYYCYFALIDNTANPDSVESFAIAQAGKDGLVNFEDLMTSGPNPGNDPVAIDFLDPTWLAGGYRAAPEPTALALLALGVAGVALRRRIR